LTIALLSFNRPDYLVQVLTSLAPQLRKGDEVFLFQDGGENRFSLRAHAREEDIDACVAAFGEIFAGDAPPCRAVFRSPENLGVAGNYRRAEAHVFDALKRDAALFLEDDLILGPHYLSTTARLLDLARDEPRIGYVAAYGDFWASLETQRFRRGVLVPMHENWGAALTRASWLAQRPLREAYWELVKDDDYTMRDDEAIRALYRARGLDCCYTSQDASRWVACCVAGLVRLTTAVCQARYIGATGVHSTPQDYERDRFADAQIYPDAPVILPPSPQQLDFWIAQSVRSFREGYRHIYKKDEPRRQSPR
jgi:hypothetical protein